MANSCDLLPIADSGNFDLFLTVDKRLPEQNRISALPIAVILLRAKSNRMLHILPFAPEILRRLPEFKPGNVYILNQPE